MHNASTKPASAAGSSSESTPRSWPRAAAILSAARGFDLAVLSELLPAAEAGLVEALCIEKGRLD